ERTGADAEGQSGEPPGLRERAGARNLAETRADQTEKSLNDNRDKLDESEASTIEGRIMELKGVLESDDVNESRQKTQELQEASHKLAEAVYAQATAEQQAGSTAGDGASTASDDEVVEDAD